MEHILLIFGIALAFLYALFAGFHDGGNLIAANVLAKSITPGKALCAACAAEFIGPFLFGSAVAVTLGGEVFEISARQGSVCLLALCAGLVSGITWGLMTWWVGMPPGSTHTLLGGLLGGFVAAFGPSGVAWSGGLAKVLTVLLIAPFAGFAACALSARLAGPGFSQGVKGYGIRLGASLLLLGTAHGSNNAQRATALVAMLLLASGSLDVFRLPSWATAGAAAALGAGVSAGGWKIMKFLKVTRSAIRPAHALISQGTAATVVLAATLLGCPVSTSQVVKASLLGSGAPLRNKDMGKILMKSVFTAWLVNFPASAIMAAAIYWTGALVLGLGMGSFEDIMRAIGQ